VIKTHVYNSFDEPALSAAQWNALLGVSNTDVIFLTWHWQRAWWETVGRGQLLLIAAERAGAIIAIAPLYAECGMVYFVGSGNSDYLDFIGDISDPAILTALLATARAGVPDFVGFRFYCLLAQSRTGERLQAAAAQLDLHCYDEESWPAPLVQLADQREAVLAAANGSRLRKRERYYHSRGALELRQFWDGEAILPQLAHFFAQYQAQWGESNYGDPVFLTRWTQVAAHTGWLRFSRLDWAGRPIAFEYGWCYGDTYFGGPSCFAGDLAPRSPGQVLLRQLLLTASAAGLSKYDLGIGDEPYKLRYATQINRVHTWGLYPPALFVDE